jgi:hypothetical protein
MEGKYMPSHCPIDSQDQLTWSIEK